MDLDLASPPKLSSGKELATWIVNGGILPKAWEAICIISKSGEDSFILIEDGGVAYVIFPSFHKQDFIDPESKYGEISIQNCKIFPAELKGDDAKPALVHKGALNRFLHILKSTDFEAKIQALKEQAVIFVGHSIGGAVAALATLWLLGKRQRNLNCFCTTFGAPLVGNATIHEAIGREDWFARFCHVVCMHDIVPRMNLAPYESIVKPLDAIVTHWWSKMGIDSDSHPHLFISEACTILVKNIEKCTSTMKKDYPGESGLRSPFIPFGIYIFCSIKGASCFEDSKTILEMLHLNMQSQEGLPFDKIAGTCISEHTDYGHMLEGIGRALQNAAGQYASNSPGMGIASELEAIGVGTQDKHTLFALRKSREVKNEQDTNIKKLNVEWETSMMSYMEELESYKMRCKDNNTAYYDAFKQNDEKGFRINLARTKLAEFWDKIVEMEEKHVLPSDFRSRKKWVYAGTAYRILAEPLDIAYHYRTEMENRRYLSEGVRPHRHIALEKWLSVALEVDSCFWAHLEEACKALRNIQHEEESRTSLKECIHFDIYVACKIGDGSISEEVFVEGSSFMIWWQQYCRIRVKSYQWRSSSYLYKRMMKESWKPRDYEGEI